MEVSRLTLTSPPECLALEAQEEGGGGGGLQECASATHSPSSNAFRLSMIVKPCVGDTQKGV